jgi:putative Mg2+ transporter-C (MgtC) family protein
MQPFNIEIQIIIRLVAAAVLGAVIGYERERAKKPAGLRTHILISMGAAMFTLISEYGFGGVNPTQIAGGIVTGIGFLGGGAIFRSKEGFVEGLTTAATIWAAAGVGLAMGAGMYILSVVATVLILIVLVLPHHFK